MWLTAKFPTQDLEILNNFRIEKYGWKYYHYYQIIREVLFKNVVPLVFRTLGICKEV